MATEKEVKGKAERLDVLQLGACSDSTGTGSISLNTIARVVTKAVRSVEGVAGFAAKGAGDIFKFFSGKAYDSNLDIQVEDGNVNLSLVLNLYYGCSVPEVINNIRNCVTTDLSKLTGAQVGKFDILVKDLVEPEEVEEDKEESEDEDEEKADK